MDYITRNINNERIIKPRVKFISGLLNKYQDDINQSIISVSTRKSIIELNNTGEIVFSPILNSESISNISKYDLTDLIYQNVRPMDVLDLSIENIDESKDDFLFKGCVDNIFRTQSRSIGGLDRKVNIRFSELLSKLLTRDELANLLIIAEDKRVQELFDPRSEEEKEKSIERGDETLPARILLFGGIPMGFGAIENRQNVFVAGSIKKAVEYILERMQGTRILIRKDGQKIEVSSEIRKSTFIQDDPYDFVFRMDLTQFQGTIYEFIASVIDRQFYEIWVDTVGDKSTLFIRPKPFERTEDCVDELKDLTNWDSLITHEIEDSELINDSTGISDYETKTLFRCYTDIECYGSQDSVPGRYGLNFPLLNIEGAKLFGLRELAGRSTVANGRDVLTKEREISGKQTLELSLSKFMETTIIRKRNKLFRWFAFPYFESGQITIRGRQNIRVGQRIFLKDKYNLQGRRGMMYYVQAVSNMWKIGNPYTQTLEVVRGQSEDGKEVKEYLNYLKDNNLLVGNEKDVLKNLMPDGIEILSNTPIEAKPPVMR